MNFERMIILSIYDLVAKSITGKEVSLSDYKDKVVLIVNTASKCGFAPQYGDLERIYKEYKDEGLVILGFPCDQFKNQEPGSNEDILEFCQVNYGVTFPLFEKVEVNGENAHPIYKYLKEKKGFSSFDSEHKLAKIIGDIAKKVNPNFMNSPDIKWNFTKFLIDRNGVVTERFEPTKNMKTVEENIKELL